MSASRTPASKPWPSTSISASSVAISSQRAGNGADSAGTAAEQHLGGAAGSVDAKHSRYLAAAFARIFQRAVDHGQRRSDFRNEGLSRGRQCDAARRPVEEAHVEAVLQRGDGVAERRGRHAEFARRRAKPAGARHGGDRLQFGQARPAHCVTTLISLSPFGELIRSSARRIFVSEVMERSSAARTIDTIYIDGAFVTPHATTERRCSILQPRNRSGNVIDDRRNDDGRFPGTIVVAAKLIESRIRATRILSIARSHDDEEDRMTFQSHNPATGELIGTYPEHDEAETNLRLQRAWEGCLRWSRTPCTSGRPFSCGSPTYWTGGRKRMAA